MQLIRALPKGLDDKTVRGQAVDAEQMRFFCLGSSIMIALLPSSRLFIKWTNRKPKAN